MLIHAPARAFMLWPLMIMFPYSLLYAPTITVSSRPQLMVFLAASP